MIVERKGRGGGGTKNLLSFPLPIPHCLTWRSNMVVLKWPLQGCNANSPQ